LVEPVRKYWAQMSAMAADDSGPVIRQASEPYTMLIMNIHIKFEMDIGRLAPASEVAGGHTVSF
jgi:hypothetical protein